jgi:predicted NBD/HSP70 family sugar kinase
VASAHNTVSRALTELHRLGGRASRNELTERLGCGRSVTGYALGELVERGLVEIDRSVSLAPGRQSGRPSHGVVIGADAPVAIAVELSSDTIAVATVALGGRIVVRDEHPIGPLGPEAVADAVSELVSAHASGCRRLIGVGVSVPSPVRAADGFVLAALHLGWPPVAFGELLAVRLGNLSFALDNDAHLAALAEHRHGAGRDATQMLYLTTGRTGLGGALVSAGRLFTGASGYAMELGHIAVNPGGTPCRCGSAGCLDVEADNRALLRAAGESDVAPGAVPLRAAQLLDAAAARDPRAVAAADAVRHTLGDGLASLVNLTDPDRIVLGGSLGRLHELAPESIPTQLWRQSLLERAGTIPVRAGQLTDPFLLGAAEMVLQRILDDPRAVPA